MAQGRSGMPMAPVGGFGQQQQGGFMPQRQLSNFGPYRQGMMGEPGIGMNGFNSGFNRQAPPMSSGYQMPNGGRAGSMPLPPTSLPSQFTPVVEQDFGGMGPRGFAGGSMPAPPMMTGGPVAPPPEITPNPVAPPMMTGGPVPPPSGLMPFPMTRPITYGNETTDRMKRENPPQLIQPVTGGPVAPGFTPVLRSGVMPGTVMDGGGAFGSGQGRPAEMPAFSGARDSQPAADAMARDFQPQRIVKPLPGTLRDSTESLDPIEPKGDIFQQAATGIGQAIGGAQREMGYQPPDVFGSRYSADRVTPGGSQYTGDVTTTGYKAPSIAENIGQFVNPFEQQVVEGTLGDIERQRQMQANQLAAQFQGARAFGGSREAIQQAELGRQAFEQGTSASSALRQQGFGQALQSAAQQAQMGQRASEFGLNQNLQAQLANQAARQRFGEFGAGQSLQAQLANQSARARANEFGLGQNLQAQLANQAARQAGSQQRLSAASQLGSLANLGFGMGQTVQNQMAQQGALQQQLQQQIMNAARSQFEGFRNYPAQALGYYAQALGATPTPQSSTTSKQPGLFDYLTLGASLVG